MNNSIRSTLVRAWLTIAVVDWIFASTLGVVAYHSTVARVWQGVASVVLGPSALQGGLRTVLVGTALHLCVAFTWTAVFLGLALLSERLRRIIATPGRRAGGVDRVRAAGLDHHVDADHSRPRRGVRRRSERGGGCRSWRTCSSSPCRSWRWSRAVWARRRRAHAGARAGVLRAPWSSTSHSPCRCSSARRRRCARCSVVCHRSGPTRPKGPDTWSAYDVVGHLIHGERTDWIPRARIILEQGRSPAVRAVRPVRTVPRQRRESRSTSCSTSSSGCARRVSPRSGVGGSPTRSSRSRESIRRSAP